MAEKRKPVYIILLRKAGKKTHKVELFNARDWVPSGKKYRIRVDGRWFPKGKRYYFYLSEIRNLIFKSIKL